jgi:type III restriction enzyme
LFGELTATPKDNNVLYSVSAAELKVAEMIKLPVVLTEHPHSWQTVFVMHLFNVKN